MALFNGSKTCWNSKPVRYTVGAIGTAGVAVGAFFLGKFIKDKIQSEEKTTNTRTPHLEKLPISSEGEKKRTMGLVDQLLNSCSRNQRKNLTLADKLVSLQKQKQTPTTKLSYPTKDRPSQTCKHLPSK